MPLQQGSQNQINLRAKQGLKQWFEGQIMKCKRHRLNPKQEIKYKLLSNISLLIISQW